MYRSTTYNEQGAFAMILEVRIKVKIVPREKKIVQVE